MPVSHMELCDLLTLLHLHIVIHDSYFLNYIWSLLKGAINHHFVTVTSAINHVLTENKDEHISPSDSKRWGVTRPNKTILCDWRYDISSTIRKTTNNIIYIIQYLVGYSTWLFLCLEISNEYNMKMLFSLLHILHISRTLILYLLNCIVLCAQ